MADEVDTNAEPPLVVRVAENLPADNPPVDEPPVVALVEPQRPRKPHPGLIEAIAWCLVFVATQTIALIVVTGVVFCVFAFLAPNPTAFVNDQLNGVTKATQENAEPNQATPFPTEMGQSLAAGMLGGQVASLGLIFLVLPWRIGKGWKRQIGLRAPRPVQVLVILLLMPGFILLTSAIEQLLKDVFGITLPSIGKNLNDIFLSFPWFLTFLAVGLGPGFVEEIWCRGFVGRGLSARYGLVVGVLVTSILFGLMHASLTYAIPTAIMGVYLHFVYLASRSIWISILLHTLNNTIAVVLTINQQASAQLDTNMQNMAGVIFLVSFVLVLFGSITLWTGRARIVPKDILEEERNERKSIGYILTHLREVFTLPEREKVDDQTWKPEYPGISAPPAHSDFRLKSGKTSPVALGLTVISFVVLVLLFVLG